MTEALFLLRLFVSIFRLILTLLHKSPMGMGFAHSVQDINFIFLHQFIHSNRSI
jgi:hypothetical protein